MGDKGGRKSKDKQTKQKASKQMQKKKQMSSGIHPMDRIVTGTGVLNGMRKIILSKHVSTRHKEGVLCQL